MAPVYIHPTVLQHPNRIAALEASTGMRSVYRAPNTQLIPIEADVNHGDTSKQLIQAAQKSVYRAEKIIDKILAANRITENALEKNR